MLLPHKAAALSLSNFNYLHCSLTPLSFSQCRNQNSMQPPRHEQSVREGQIDALCFGINPLADGDQN